MERIKKWFCAAVCAAVFGGAAAQDAAGTKTLTLFKGDTIREIRLSGDFDVVIRQGTPGGVVLEVPDSIPVVMQDGYKTKPIRFSKEWMYKMYDRRDEIRDTVRCFLTDGKLQLSNTRFTFHGQGKGALSMIDEARFKGKAVITVSELKDLTFFSKGTLRFSGDVRMTSVGMSFFNGAHVSGLDLRATEKMSISVFNNGKVEARISGTPRVDIKVFNNSNANLTVNGVGYLDVNAFNGGWACLQGTADSLATRVYQGKVDVTGLKANTIVSTE